MNTHLKMASLAALTVATLALPVAAQDMNSGAKCAARKCAVKCAPKCATKGAPKCAPKCAPKN